MTTEVYELTAGQVRERFPQFTVNDAGQTVLRPLGRVPAKRTGAGGTWATLAREAGVTVLENTLVTAVEETGGRARVRTGAEWMAFDHAVVAAGPWVAELLPAMKKRVRVTRQQMALLRTRRPRTIRTVPFSGVVDPFARQPVVRVSVSARRVRQGGGRQQAGRCQGRRLTRPNAPSF